MLQNDPWYYSTTSKFPYVLNALTYIFRKLRFRERQFEICLQALSTQNHLQPKKMRFLALEAFCFRISDRFR